MNEKITDNPIKFDITGEPEKNDGLTRRKTFRGEKSKINIYEFDGNAFGSISFSGIAYTREDALRLAEFFQCHAYCLRKEDGNF